MSCTVCTRALIMRGDQAAFLRCLPFRRRRTTTSPESYRVATGSEAKAVIGAIPLRDQPIFWWLKYTLRRPAEAMALLKEDFKDGMFTVHRSFSAKVASR